MVVLSLNPKINKQLHKVECTYSFSGWHYIIELEKLKINFDLST